VTIVGPVQTRRASFFPLGLFQGPRTFAGATLKHTEGLEFGKKPEEGTMAIFGAIVLLAGFSAAQAPAPSPSPTPPRTIIRIKSTPFCQVFRDNTFHAVEGLRINDQVIGQGRIVFAKWAYARALAAARAERLQPRFADPRVFMATAPYRLFQQGHVREGHLNESGRDPQGRLRRDGCRCNAGFAARSISAN
jgi:hypothetical protein